MNSFFTGESPPSVNAQCDNTSGEKPTPNQVTYNLRNLGVQGIFDQISGIIAASLRQKYIMKSIKPYIKKC